MKKLVLPILLICLLSISKDYGVASSAEIDASGRTIHLSHNQYSVTYAGASVNDVVGVFDPWYPTQDTTSGKFSYSLVSSKNGTYAINNSTGLVTISNTSNLTPGMDTLIVRTTLQGRTEDNNLFVKVKATSDCYFIDPSAGSNGSGTRNSPFNSWSGVSFKAGKAYFQKRGTTNKFPIVIRTSGTNGNEIILGAYGNGNRPIISCGDTKIGMQLYAGYIWFFEYEFTNNLYGIETESNTSNASTYVHDLFSDLTLHHNKDNGQLYFKRLGDVGKNDYFHRVYDINASYGQTYGMKIEGSQNIIENFRGHQNGKMAISIPIWGDYNKISGLSTYNNGNNGMEMSGVGNEASYCYFKNEYRGLVVDDPGSAKSFIHHCFFEGGTGDASIKLRAQGAFWQTQVVMSSGKDVTIEDNVIRNNPNYAAISVEYAMKNTSIRRNKIYNCNRGILIGTANTGVDQVKIEYNVMYNNTTDISAIAGGNIYIYNNTCDGVIDCSNSTGETAQNNFYKTLTGVSTSSNNIDIDAIKTSDYFTNYAGRNYRLKSTATGAIGQGKDVGLKLDILGQSISGVPDIGAYEFVAVNEISNQAPSINDQTFDVSSDNVSTFSRKIVASDKEDGQNLKYSIVTGNEAGIFILNASTGVLTLNAAKISFDVALTYSLKVAVSDYGTPALSGNATVKIIVNQIVNLAPVVNDQSFLISKEDVNTFSKKIVASEPNAGQVLKYSITSGNDAGIFSLNATTGILTCNASKISFEEPVTHNLLVTATDNGSPNLSDGAAVKISTESNIPTFYIDPTNQQDAIQNGTEEHPFSTWKQVSWVSGNTYLQKCGTVSQETKVNITANNVRIGSYGEGELPVIQSSVNDFAIRAFEKSNLIIEDLHIIAPEAVSCIYIMGEGTDSITIRNSKFEGAVNGVRVLNALNITIIYNTFIKNSEAVYCYAEKSLIYYNVFMENAIAINALGNASTSKIYNNVFYNNDLGISNSYSELTVYNNIFYLGNESNTAINNQMDKLVSDNNIFYPEREGFIKMENKSYNSLIEFQRDKSLDLNSFMEDPQFVDVYNMNFAPKMTSPAINAGKTVGLQEDFYGSSVPNGYLPDIGLIEWNYSAGSPTAMPDISDSPIPENFQIYPNPSSGVFNVYVKNETSSATSITVKDLMGKSVFMNTYGSSLELLQQIDISHLSKGIYIVVIENAGQSLSQTIIIN